MPQDISGPLTLLTTRQQAAVFLGVSVQTIDRLITAGELVGYRILGCVRLCTASIEAYLAASKIEE